MTDLSEQRRLITEGPDLLERATRSSGPAYSGLTGRCFGSSR